ncbi:MAG: CRISPR-associated endonuclease Cas2 [Polaromonas sp.]
MSLNQTATWLVTYDIADPRRLAKVFKRLKKAGVPLQYSVFSVEASAAGMAALMAQLARLIHAREDDIRAYRLPEHGWRTTLGEPILPEGLWLR